MIFRCLNIWSPVGGSLEGWSGVALLEEICHWGWVLRFQSLQPFPVCSPCFLLPPQDVNSQTAAVPAMIDSCLLELHTQINFYKSSWSQALSQGKNNQCFCYSSRKGSHSLQDICLILSAQKPWAVRGGGCCSHSLRGGNNLSKANQMRLLIKLLSKPHSYEDSAVACMKRLQRNNYEITLSNLK